MKRIFFYEEWQKVGVDLEMEKWNMIKIMWLHRLFVRKLIIFKLQTVQWTIISPISNLIELDLGI